MFCQGKHSRTINLNTHILVLMKNPRDLSQIQCLARQTFVGKSKFSARSFQRWYFPALWIFDRGFLTHGT